MKSYVEEAEEMLAAAEEDKEAVGLPQIPHLRM